MCIVGEYPLYIDDSSNYRTNPCLCIVGEYPLYINDISNYRTYPYLCIVGEYPLYINDSNNYRTYPCLYIVGEYPLYIDDSSNSRDLPNLPVFDSAGESEDHTYRTHDQVVHCSHLPIPILESLHYIPLLTSSLRSVYTFRRITVKVTIVLMVMDRMGLELILRIKQPVTIDVGGGDSKGARKCK